MDIEPVLHNLVVFTFIMFCCDGCCVSVTTHHHTLTSVGLHRRKTGIQAENWIPHPAACCTGFKGPPVPANIKEKLLSCSLAGFHIRHFQAEHKCDDQVAQKLKAPCAAEARRAPNKQAQIKSAMINFIVYSSSHTFHAAASFTGCH